MDIRTTMTGYGHMIPPNTILETMRDNAQHPRAEAVEAQLAPVIEHLDRAARKLEAALAALGIDPLQDEE